MHDPLTQICSFPSYRMNCWMQKQWWIPKRLANFTLFTLWHKDPDRKGDDDSCGWFKRARHGDKVVLQEIVKRFGEDWDRVFESRDEDSTGQPKGPVRKVYFCGYFYPEEAGAGMPNMGVSAIALNLFFLAAGVHFSSDGQTNWGKARRWMQANLFDILLFAENPTDSLRDSIVRKWGCDDKREDRICQMASCIYGWILRREQRWYQHPRWHVHHWRFQIQIWQLFHRWAFQRCAKCGKRFHFNESVCGSWSGDQVWHMACEYGKPDPIEFYR